MGKLTFTDEVQDQFFPQTSLFSLSIVKAKKSHAPAQVTVYCGENYY